MTMVHPFRITCMAALALGALSLGACSIQDLIPQTANGVGASASLVQAELQTPRTRSSIPGVSSYQVELVDVLLHDPQKDRWTILNDKAVTMQVADDAPQIPTFSPVPIAAGRYDKARLVFANGKISVGGHAQELKIEPAQIDLDGPWEFQGDHSLKVRVNFSSALKKNAQGEWSFSPSFRLSLEDADFSDQKGKKEDKPKSEGPSDKRP